MRTTFISTATLINAPRSAMARLQSDVASATKELSTGRYADVGLQLGWRSSQSVTLRREASALETLKDNNALASGQIDRTTVVLDQMRKTASDFIATTIGTSGNPALNAAALKTEAQAGLNSLVAGLNSSDGQRFIFGGINSAVVPVKAYDSGAGGPKASVDAALATYLGAQGLTDISQMSAAQVTDFLETDFEDVFLGAAWNTNWSSAADDVRTSELSPGERVDVSVSANEQAMRKLAMGYTMLGQLDTQELSPTAFDALLTKARSVISDGMTGLTTIGAELGLTKNKIQASTDVLLRATDLGAAQLDTLEGVDPAEAKTRLDLLTTQLEMSYSLTGQISRLSILNYI
jgi:flagellar hook-associated protein 3 FlgL